MKTLIISCMLGLVLQAKYLFASGIKLVDVDIYNSGIITEIRYFTQNNFVGEKIDGYHNAKCLLSERAARALVKAQTEFQSFGFSIKVFDCYRPQRAVDHFVRWAKDTTDTRMKAQFYPQVAKKDLFRKGYIAERSGHSRASTLDLTLVNGQTGLALDMGTPWDYFSTLSWPSNSTLSDNVRAHRMLLATVMEKHGFIGLKEEWWHFTLKDEPFPTTYFDQPIK